MLEMLINPRKAERRPWELFFVGFVYASLAMLIVYWVFSKDEVLSRYSGLLIVTFTVLFSMPFVYYTMKFEEHKISEKRTAFSLLIDHRKAIYAFMWLFLGFTVAFSFWYILLSANQSFEAQIETFCMINRPSGLADCVKQYGITGKSFSATGFASSRDRLISIFTNNVYVLMFTLIFSLILGAGAIFILAWNASVIAAAIGIFSKSDITTLPLGIARYMIHGGLEIAAYFIVALSGGILSLAIIKREAGKERFWEVLQDCLNLVLVAIVILLIAAIVEVFVTPALF